MVQSLHVNMFNMSTSELRSHFKSTPVASAIPKLLASTEAILRAEHGATSLGSMATLDELEKIGTESVYL